EGKIEAEKIVREGEKEIEEIKLKAEQNFENAINEAIKLIRGR
ncbi:V-type ATP synthase subunit H, partial [Thermococci archaeon]